MKENKGFIELNTVNDYWKKLQHDYLLLSNNCEDVYLAFNFFVTAYHLIDWIFEGERSRENEERKVFETNSLMKICFHICNGAKHFNPLDKRNDSVKKIEKDKYVDEDYCDVDYVESPIIIYLEDNLKEEFGSSISITDLSNKIMIFWKVELIRRKLIQDL